MKSHCNPCSQISIALWGAILCLSPFTLFAGGDSSKDLKDMPSKSVETSKCEKDWAVELSSGVLFSNIRVGSANNNTMVPIQVAGVLKVDDVSLDELAGGVFRGNTEFVFRGDYYQVMLQKYPRPSTFELGIFIMKKENTMMQPRHLGRPIILPIPFPTKSAQSNFMRSFVSYILDWI